jgi:glc operon protein GlcG
MQNLIQIACASCLVAATAATSQTPASQPPAGRTPDNMPFDIPYGTTIGPDTAKRLPAIAEAEAMRHDWKINIAVVDTHGEVPAFERMDRAQYASIAILQNKARTSARSRRETRVFYNQFETGHAYVDTLDAGLVASLGRFPLVEGGKLVGAIGCSGGTGDQDPAVCKAAADTIKQCNAAVLGSEGQPNGRMASRRSAARRRAVHAWGWWAYPSRTAQARDFLQPDPLRPRTEVID